MRISANPSQIAANPRAANNRGRYASALLASIIIPPLLLLDAWKSRSHRFQHYALTFFVTIFGTVCMIEHGDAVRHLAVVERYYNTLGFADFLTQLWQIITFQDTASGARDVYKHVLSYITGGVLNAPFLFYPIVAGVYGYFFAGSVLYILQHASLKRLNYVLLATIFVLLFIKGIDGFYTVRTWTGMWVLVYACLKYYETRKWRYLLLMFAPPLIHFGYFLMAIPAWIVLAAGSRTMLYSAILVASTFFNFIPAQPVTQQLSQTEAGSIAVSSYLREEERDAIESFEQQQQQTNFYNAYRKSGLQRWAPAILAFTLIGSGIYLRNMSPYQRRIFSVGVLMLAFSNLTWFLYAVHNRTLLIATVFILAGYLMARLDPETAPRFRGLPPYYQWGLHLSLLFFFPLMLFNLSMLSERLNIWLFAAPFVSWFFPEADISIKELLRWIL
jgi:hypothetical protein